MTQDDIEVRLKRIEHKINFIGELLIACVALAAAVGVASIIRLYVVADLASIAAIVVVGFGGAALARRSFHSSDRRRRP